MPGVGFLNNLIFVLLSFREQCFAVIAGIEKFHHVRVRLVDIDSVRKLAAKTWANFHDDITGYLMVKHIFGKVDSLFSSNQALQKILKF